MSEKVVPFFSLIFRGHRKNDQDDVSKILQFLGIRGRRVNLCAVV